MDTQRLTGDSLESIKDENEYQGPSPQYDICNAFDQMNKVPLREAPTERDVDGSQS